MGTANSKNYPHLGLLKYKKIRPLDLKLPPDLKTILYYYIILKKRDSNLTKHDLRNQIYFLT